jgi:hypothetical protein
MWRYGALAVMLLALVSCATVMGPEEPPPPPPGSGPGAITPNALFYESLSEGAPDPSIITVQGGFYVWRTGYTWHVRASRPNDYPTMDPQGPTFTGKVSVDRANIIGRENKSPDPFAEIHFGNRTIDFRIENRVNDRRVSGFDFVVKPLRRDYCVTFDLKMNNTASPNIVYLGKSLRIPDELPLLICFRP